jgi:hypothetical protein
MNNNNNNIYYSIVDFPNDNQLYGKFKGSSPKKAANKALSCLIKFMNNNEDFFGKFIVFVIKNNSTKKEYKYIGNRIKLENPIKVEKNGKTIIYKYKNVIGKFREELDLI